MKKFVIWLFGIKWHHIGPTYYHCYGFGAHMRVLGDDIKNNPYTYGTFEHDAWSHGWNGRK